jgi:hypothetical protein
MTYLGAGCPRPGTSPQTGYRWFGGVMNVDAKQLPALEQECSKCHGRGSDYYGRCAACNGSGWEPTEAGDAILSLLRHQISDLLQR